MFLYFGGQGMRCTIPLWCYSSGRTSKVTVGILLWRAPAADLSQAAVGPDGKKLVRCLVRADHSWYVLVSGSRCTLHFKEGRLFAWRTTDITDVGAEADQDTCHEALRPIQCIM